jgi:hypothetical protein
MKHIKPQKKHPTHGITMRPPQQRVVKSLLDEMVEGREYSSILGLNPQGMDLKTEILKAISAIETIRQRPLICYVANVVNTRIKSSIGIDSTDDLPFAELVQSVALSSKDVDIMLVTPGGSAEQVAKFVNKLRPRFDNVSFILPNISMSAGTIFCLSGDELMMEKGAYIGPIDPQVPGKDGRFVPAQSLLTLIGEIQTRGKDLLDKGQNPLWTDLQILRNIDAKEIGNAINASKFSIELVTDYLFNFKFKNWVTHSDQRPVTADEKRKRAEEIASQLCDHSVWKTHGRGITREMAETICRLKVLHPETLPGLDSSVQKMWALIYWIFENTNLIKIFISNNYAIFRSDIQV